jgi:hypothetical protein
MSIGFGFLGAADDGGDAALRFLVSLDEPFRKEMLALTCLPLSGRIVISIEVIHKQ